MNLDVDAVDVVKRHGAYLVNLRDPHDSLVPEERFDVASSLTKAKQLARELAAAYGYEGACRWEQDMPNSWVLFFAAEPERDY